MPSWSVRYRIVTRCLKRPSQKGKTKMARPPKPKTRWLVDFCSGLRLSNSGKTVCFSEAQDVNLQDVAPTWQEYKALRRERRLRIPSALLPCVHKLLSEEPSVEIDRTICDILGLDYLGKKESIGGDSTVAQ
jgi:hypothetical protein